MLIKQALFMSSLDVGRSVPLSEEELHQNHPLALYLREAQVLVIQAQMEVLDQTRTGVTFFPFWREGLSTTTPESHAGSIQRTCSRRVLPEGCGRKTP